MIVDVVLVARNPFRSERPWLWPFILAVGVSVYFGILIEFYRSWDHDSLTTQQNIMCMFNEEIFDVTATLGGVTVLVSIAASVLCWNELSRGLALSRKARLAVRWQQLILTTVLGVADVGKFFIYLSAWTDWRDDHSTDIDLIVTFLWFLDPLVWLAVTGVGWYIFKSCTQKGRTLRSGHAPELVHLSLQDDLRHELVLLTALGIHTCVKIKTEQMPVFQVPTSTPPTVAGILTSRSGLINLQGMMRLGLQERRYTGSSVGSSQHKICCCQ